LRTKPETDRRSEKTNKSVEISSTKNKPRKLCVKDDMRLRKSVSKEMTKTESVDLNKRKGQRPFKSSI
jgi:hypothetical protein